MSRFNLATWLTLLRIALIPVLVVCFYLPWPGMRVLAAFVFVVASVTDWLDGWLARRLGQTTRFGAFLDPVADKLMVASALVLLVQYDPEPGMAIAAVIIIGREITIASLREWMAEIGQRGVVEVSWLGKVKTTLQMAAITLLLFGIEWWHGVLWPLGRAGLYLAAVMTLWSMVNYLRAAWPALMRGR
ncbi:CDP-diacylglycerol---glycerol-3-phosphate 3-phosphatidyltransferase [Methylomarinovum caldicuralii]|uniref:CDP-diacylglycerol--glycerol-3-phosphate 3-phosphatidyltransferase n=1 Tax=Methylomarinovum caldicuralii TaxID=438856 RepID=A0AAU9C7M5_9GAMM|nr:CDP-diacylglycerol--glycerol-3-phosphate 3-phosphatidyltransferase [Methylomarinovum caldicuralii]BCX82049.1 CDP-diacylglycerol---glycerol-3-phosphate 3-phosphatidyltransferase [Methylomarinovum caldicuralii]